MRSFVWASPTAGTAARKATAGQQESSARLQSLEARLQAAASPQMENLRRIARAGAVQGAEQAATELGDVIWAAVSDILALFYHGLYAQLTALVCGYHPPTVDLLNRWTVRATKRSASSRAARSFRHSNSTPVLRIGKRARSRRCTIWRRTQRIRPFSAPRNTSRTSKNHSLRPNLSLGGAAAPMRISLMGSADVERSL